MTYIVVDVETDGPCPGLFSMVSLGAVVVEPKLNQTFFAQTAPISTEWQPEALAISQISREQHLAYPNPAEAMKDFNIWLKQIEEKSDSKLKRLIFVSDNLAFDWQFINYYFHKYIGVNPFGFSGRRIGDMYAGFFKDVRYNWKKHRKTKHDHNPVNDAIGNAEAMLHLEKIGFNI